MIRTGASAGAGAGAPGKRKRGAGGGEACGRRAWRADDHEAGMAAPESKQ